MHETLLIINNLNQNCAFGTFYINKKNVFYYLGLSLEGRDDWFSKYQINDYINGIKAGVEEVAEQLNDRNILIKQNNNIRDNLENKQYE